MTTSPSSQPRVSVVIPSYNHERYLEETIRSVLDQRGVDLELVVIDDGSRDGSWDLIQRMAQQDARLRPFRQENQGAHAAINAGLRAGRGDFLAVLNSDDRYHPDRLATLLQLAEAGNGLDFISTGLRLIDDDSRLTTEHVWLEEYERMRASAHDNGLWETLLERNFTVSTSNFFFRRSLYEALGPIRPLRYNMDWDYALRAYLREPARFAWRDDLVLWDYRLHGSNTITGGLPVSAIEANHLLYRAIKQGYHVPASALAGLRRHYKLIRQQQVAKVAAARDTHWEAELQKAHAGWQEAQTAWESAREAHDKVHDNLGQTLTKLGATLTDLGEARGALQETREAKLAVEHELALVYASRSYKLGRKLTAPLRWLREKRGAMSAEPAPPVPTSPQAAAETAVPAEPPANTEPPPYRRIDLPEPLQSALPRVAVHVHTHYTELLGEMLDAVCNLPGEPDVYVTTTGPAQAIEAAVHERLPQAKVWQTANQGKDIGPFIDALNRHRLDQYDLVLKLHGKKSRNQPSYLAAVRGLFGPDIKDGDDWRRKLIRPIAGSRERVLRIYQAFHDDPRLAMAGAAKFICAAPDADPQGYRRLCERLGVTQGIRFFGGTMFWIRGGALAPLLEAGMTQGDFDPAQAGNVESTLEHGCERVFGGLAAKDGGYLAGLDEPEP